MMTSSMRLRSSRLKRNTAILLNVMRDSRWMTRASSGMTFSNMTVFRFNHEERNRMLDVIINYYRLHNAAIGTLRSPDILKQLFV